MDERGSSKKMVQAAAAFLAVMTLAASALAQTRPTLSAVDGQLSTLQSEHSALQAEHVQTRAAACVMAETSGATYRPFFCSPRRCDCLDGPTASSCAEVAAGDFEIVATKDDTYPSTCVQDTQQVYGTCEIGFICSASSQSFCTFGGGECTYPELCSAPDQFTPGACFIGCADDDDCAISFTGCVGPAGSCATSADCPVGSECSGGACTSIQACTPGQSCGTISWQRPVVYTLSPVAAVQEIAPTTCAGDGESIAISSADALECIAQAEAATGVPCAYLCGDGGVDPGEQCDDGNTTPGDGCDAACQLE